MKYRITGADRTTGADRIVSVEADDEVHAVALARDQGVFTYRVDLVHGLDPSADLPEETRGQDHSKRKEEQRVARNSLTGGVLLVILVCGIWIGLIRERSTSPPAVSNRDTGHDDPRDRRFDSPDGREVVRAIAEQAGVSDQEARKSLNDEIDRRGLSDWADNQAMSKGQNATSSYSTNPTMHELHEILVPAGYLVGDYGENLAWKKGDEAVYFEVHGSGNGQINRQIRVLTPFKGGTKVWSSRHIKVEGNRILILDDHQEWVSVL